MINEELNKIKYLFGYKKGVVISEQVTPPSTGVTGNTTTQTTSPQKVDLGKLRDCANFKSGGKLTKGEEKDGFILFNNEKGIPVCKKSKE